MTRYTKLLLHTTAMVITVAMFVAGMFGFTWVGALCLIAMGSVVSMCLRFQEVYELPNPPITLGKITLDLTTDHGYADVANAELYVETNESYVPLRGGFLATLNQRKAVILTPVEVQR